MKDKLIRFVMDEDGVETIEFIGLVCVAAALIVVIMNIGASMQESAESSLSVMDSALDGIINFAE